MKVWVVQKKGTGSDFIAANAGHSGYRFTARITDALWFARQREAEDFNECICAPNGVVREHEVQ